MWKTWVFAIEQGLARIKNQDESHVTYYLLPVAGKDLMNCIALCIFSLVTFCSSFFHSYTLLLYIRMLNRSAVFIFWNMMGKALWIVDSQSNAIELLISMVNTKSLGRDVFMTWLKKYKPRSLCHYG